METIRKLNYLLDRKTKLRTVVLFFLILIGSFAELSGVAIVLPIVNLAMDQGPIESNQMAKIVMDITGIQRKETLLLIFIALAIGIYIIKDAYLIYMNNKLYRFSADIKRQMATRLMKSYLEQPYSFFLYKNTSELIRSVNSDTAQLYEIVNNCLQVMANGLTALGLAIYLAMTNFVMTMTVAGLLAICAAIIILGLQKKFRQFGRENQKLNGFLIKYLQQSFEGIKEIKILNNENHFINKYSQEYKKQTDIGVKNTLYGIIPKYVIEVVCIAGILGYLAINIVYNANYMAIMPQLAVFCVAAYKLLPSVNAIYSYTNIIIFHRASIDLVYNDVKEADQLSNTFDRNDKADVPICFSDSIRIDNVSFRYDKTDRNVFSDVNIEIQRGKSVAFIGPSGGGKTTLADIVLSILLPTKGHVYIDSVDVQEDIWGWRKKVGYIPQQIYLTDDTIRSNIAFGISEKDIDDSQVWNALEGAQLKDFVKNLPKGLDTIVGERGARISGGQRQRIGIARALYRNPEVLVFDEATSALDGNTEKEVMKAVDGLQGLKTIIIIAHRLSTIENCDVVYQIKDGKVIRER